MPGHYVRFLEAKNDNKTKQVLEQASKYYIIDVRCLTNIFQLVLEHASKYYILEVRCLTNIFQHMLRSFDNDCTAAKDTVNATATEKYYYCNCNTTTVRFLEEEMTPKPISIRDFPTCSRTY